MGDRSDLALIDLTSRALRLLGAVLFGCGVTAVFALDVDQRGPGGSVIGWFALSASGTVALVAILFFILFAYGMKDEDYRNERIWADYVAKYTFACFMSFLLGLCFAFLALNENFPDAPPVFTSPAEIEGLATIIDGETLRIGSNTIRLVGIKSPDPENLLGIAASGFLGEIINGSSVACLSVASGINGIMIGRCQTIGAKDPAFLLLREGLANVRPQELETHNYAFAYFQAQEWARLHRLGVWAEN